MRKILSSYLILFTLIACQPAAENKGQSQKSSNKQIDIQGHRGARGLLPENTIPAMIKALEIGVTTLELDLAVTKDSVLILSHEPWMNHATCTDSLGESIGEEKAMSYNIFQMTYEEVQRFDCGSQGNPRFPDQERRAVSKPSLENMIMAVKDYVEQNNIELPAFNIEIKSMPQGDDIYHPSPARFSDMVYQKLNNLLPWEKVIIQSFDFRVLQYFNEQYPKVTLAALIENDRAASENLDSLGFKPDIYSSYYIHLTSGDVEYLHGQNIRVIPWTVNEEADMEKLITLGVDGIITDYPDRAMQFK